MDKLCSGEIYGKKFLVPCDPVGYLNFEYGKEENWIKPKKSNYTWSNLDSKMTYWSREQWPYAIRFYDENGNVKKDFTIRYLNDFHPGLNLKQLP